MTNREYYVSEPQSKADASIIWLHGLGASGDDFAGIVSELGLPADHKVRFIFPNAPFMPITINQGMQMRAWYDIYNFDSLHVKEDSKGIAASQLVLERLIQEQLDQGIQAKRIILAGFSQGGAIALYTGLRYKQQLGGMVILSTYLPLLNSFVAKDFTANQSTPIFIAHGVFDPIVPYALGQAAYNLLAQHNYNVTWHSYPMLHTVCPDEIDAIGVFINECLGYA